MNPFVRYAGQAVLYGAFAAALGVFSTWPRYTHLPPDQALVKVSFTHTAQHVGECRRRSDEEMAKLPPNMRVREVCPRERAPVRFELDIDGKAAYREVLQPSGLAHDGAASLYRRMAVPAGTHRIEARISDRADGEFDYTREETVVLAPAQILLVGFSASGDGLVFRR